MMQQPGGTYDFQPYAQQQSAPMFHQPQQQAWQAQPAMATAPTQATFTQLVNSHPVQYQLVPVAAPSAAPQAAGFAVTMAQPQQQAAQPSFAQQHFYAPPPYAQQPIHSSSYHSHASTPVNQPTPMPSFDLQRQVSVAPSTAETSFRQLSMPPQQPAHQAFAPIQPSEQTEIFSPLYGGHLVPSSSGEGKLEVVIDTHDSSQQRKPLLSQRASHAFDPATHRGGGGGGGGGGRRGRGSMRGGRGGFPSGRRTEIIARDPVERANKEVGLRMKELLRGSTPLVIDDEEDEVEVDKPNEHVAEPDDLVVSTVLANEAEPTSERRPAKIARRSSNSDEIDVGTHSSGSSTSKGPTASLVDLLDQHVASLETQLTTARSLLDIARAGEAAYASKSSTSSRQGGDDQKVLLKGVPAYLAHLGRLVKGKKGSSEKQARAWAGLLDHEILRGHAELEKLIVERVQPVPVKVQTIAEVVAASLSTPVPTTPRSPTPPTAPIVVAATTEADLEQPTTTTTATTAEDAAVAVSLTPSAPKLEDVVTNSSAAAACVSSAMSVEDASARAIELALRKRNSANASAARAAKDELLSGANAAPVAKSRANKRKSVAAS